MDKREQLIKEANDCANFLRKCADDNSFADSWDCDWASNIILDLLDKLKKM